MFDIGIPEVLVLGILAVIVFGPERLPDLARKAAKALRYVRQLAGNAQNQLKSELGEDFDNLDFRDLNPKVFVQKHLLSDIEPLVEDAKADLKSVTTLGKDTMAEATTAINEAKASVRKPKSVSTGRGITATVVPALDGRRITTPFDPDAT